MYTIATLHELQRHLGLTESDAAGDADLRRALQKASHLIEALTQRRYCPSLGNRTVSIDKQNPGELILPDDLLRLNSVRSGAGIIGVDAFRLLPAQPDLPASVMLVREGAAFEYGSSPGDELSVNGIWGWHDRWTRAWRDSGDSVGDNPLSAAATSISVNDVDGNDQYAEGPRFQVGHLLRIEDEYLRVTEIDSAGNLLEVLRGVQGTEAANHARGEKIETYAAVPAIRDLCLRYAALLINSVGWLEDDSPALLKRLRRLTA